LGDNVSGSYDAAWRTVRARVLEGAQWCHICGGVLDHDAPPRSPLAPSVDHVLSLRALRDVDRATFDRLRLDPANCRPTHYGCNSRRGDGRSDQPRHISRKWE
jgi:5-methylcytosine-specific restriction endonuclease McrA